MTKDEIMAAARDLAGARKPFVRGTVDACRCPQLRWRGDLRLPEGMEPHRAEL